MTDHPMGCISHPCRSPIACKGFGYCRDMHLISGLARRAVDAMSPQQKAEMFKRVHGLHETSLADIAKTFKENS
jgi:hypothetical protein